MNIWLGIAAKMGAGTAAMSFHLYYLGAGAVNEKY